MIPIKILNDGQWQEFNKAFVIIGSGEDADVHVPGAAQRHAYILCFKDRVELLPTGANVYINDGLTLGSHIRLKSGDHILIGRKLIRLDVAFPQGHMDVQPAEEIFRSLFQRWNDLPPLVRAGHSAHLLRFAATNSRDQFDFGERGLHRRANVEKSFNEANALMAELAHLLASAADFDAEARGIDADIAGGGSAQTNFLEFVKTYKPRRFE